MMDLLVTLTTRQGVALLNSTQVGRRQRCWGCGLGRELKASWAGAGPSLPCAAVSLERAAILHHRPVLNHPRSPTKRTFPHPSSLQHTLAPLQDYSFLETPELPVDTNSTIIPRRALPNPRIPATLNGTLVWGALPTAGNATVMVDGASITPAMEGGNGTAPELPAGITCEPTSNGGQNCG